MKVLFIARRFPPSVGGMERFAYDLSASLEKNVDLLKITYGGSNKWLPFVLPVFFVRAAWTLISHTHIDVIHMQDAVLAPIGWLLSKLFKRPYTVVAHGLDITFEKAYYQQLILPFVRRADAVVSISSATNDEVLKRGVDSSKAHVITLGTHDDYSGKPLSDRDALSNELNVQLNGRFILLTTGRLVKRKGVAWFIENAMPKIVSLHPEILYLVVGDGNERENIETAISKCNLNENVKLMGRVSDTVRALAYQSSDAFVMPNVVVPGDMEGFGIVVHEAAVAGLPVVASNLEGIKDALQHDKNGLLVETRDTEAFITVIAKLIDDHGYRASFGAAAREYTLREYSWTRIAEKYYAVYKNLLK